MSVYVIKIVTKYVICPKVVVKLTYVTKLTLLVIINGGFLLKQIVTRNILLCSSCFSHSNTAVIEQGIIHSCPVPSQTPV